MNNQIKWAKQYLSLWESRRYELDERTDEVAILMKHLYALAKAILADNGESDVV